MTKDQRRGELGNLLFYDFRLVLEVFHCPIELSKPGGKSDDNYTKYNVKFKVGENSLVKVYYK